MVAGKDKFIGCMDRFELDSISGWACYEDNERRPILECLLNDQVIGTIRPEKFRKDLVSIKPSGKIAFSVQLNIIKGNKLRFLPRTCRIVIRDALTGVVLKNGDKVFVGGRDDDSNIFADGKGRKFRVNKGGCVIPLSEYSPELKKRILGLLERLITETDSVGNHLVLGYGSLLGAVRQKDFLPHDDDVDCIYIAEATSMLSAAKEFNEYATFLESKGHEVEINSNGQFHVYGREENGQRPSIDIFLAWFSNDRLNLTFTLKEGLSRDEVFPITKIEFAGGSYPAVYRSEAMLEAIYGPNWLTPDPAFNWDTPTEVTQYFLPMHNYNINANSSYWSEYYKTRDLKSPPTFPSQFAIFVMSLNESFSSVVELGCGNGRDTFFMGKHGLNVIAADFDQGVIENNTALAKEEGLSSNVTFQRVDFSNLSSISNFMDAIQSNWDSTKVRCFYSRFFFHAIDINTQASVFEFLSQALGPNDIFACEFRIDSDANGKKVTSEHYRRFIQPMEFIRHAARNGLECDYFVKGEGYANYKVDDASVARMLFRKRR